MPNLPLFAVLVLLTALGFVLGRTAVRRQAHGHPRRLHSRPVYHGVYVALWCGLPALAVVLLWLWIEPHLLKSFVLSALPADIRALDPGRLGLVLGDIRLLAQGGQLAQDPAPAIVAAAQHLAELESIGWLARFGLGLAVAAGGLTWAYRRLSPGFRARPQVERVIRAALIASSALAILVTLGIVLSLLVESVRFFERVPIAEFLFGLDWSPQTALRADQVGSSGHFGAVPLFVGTLLISAIAMLVAAPVGLFVAIYLSEYAAPRLRDTVKPLLEILAGIPTVVYGFFAAITIGPGLRALGERFGYGVASESALAAGLVMGVMIIPFVSSLSDDVIRAVPNALREGALGLGSTQSETIRRVVLPAALPGIVASLMLAISRAIGETMIVVMAAGLAANLTLNPFQAVTTVTVQIVSVLIGDQEFDSPKTLAAFALGLTLFVITLGLNILALRVVQAYREQYE
ncbi:MAG: phosphate ABC transporter permease subunit PstC [Rhodospirillales bacterium]|nr:phosphate ABC transporter permease subunit PstC [Rhodospirillales bacterium]